MQGILLPFALPNICINYCGFNSAFNSVLALLHTQPCRAGAELTCWGPQKFMNGLSLLPVGLTGEEGSPFPPQVSLQQGQRDLGAGRWGKEQLTITHSNIFYSYFKYLLCHK